METESAATLGYLNADLPISERVADLIQRMTLSEKTSQLSYPAQAIPRLGIPAYNYWSEGLHGVARNGRATVFPQAIGMAATWDPDLILRVGSAIAVEARAKYHEALRQHGETGRYQGLTFWSPNINIFRDPRWGRGQETWGEDPFLTGEMASAFVRGMQGDDPHYLQVAACAKHYAVHSGPENLRHTFNAIVSPRDLYATYLPAFQKLVTEAHVEAVMGAYNRTNGEPCCASHLLMEEILRGAWGFRGHYVSDCGALSDMHRSHRVTHDAAESAALALARGCDLACDQVFDEIPIAIERGLITEKDVDRALARTLTTRFKLGMFDPPERVPYSTISPEVIGCESHRQLAYEVAVKSIVLLKNTGNLLPLSNSVRSIYLVGPNAASVDVLLGNYPGYNDRMTTVLEGIVGALPEGVRFEYRQGCLLNASYNNPHDWSADAAAKFDVTIACMGLSPLMEGEEGDAFLSSGNGDRSDIGLPDVQSEFIKRLAAQGKKVVLILTGGGPLSLGDLVEMVAAIVWVWYPGQEGGRAVADVLFGRANPSGRLPVTFPRSTEQLPPFEDYAMHGRTYRYADWEPLYPFGFGLSYSQFAYSHLELAQKVISCGEALQVKFQVTNVGEIEDEQVVQFYLSDLKATVNVPYSTLIGFQRIRLSPQESVQAQFTVTPEMLMLVDDSGKRRLEPGTFRLTIGGCSPGERGVALGAPAPVRAEFRVIV